MYRQPESGRRAQKDSRMTSEIIDYCLFYDTLLCKIVLFVYCYGSYRIRI